MVLTADNEPTSAAVAAQLGSTRGLAGVLASGRAGEVQRLQNEGKHVGMVGDAPRPLSRARAMRMNQSTSRMTGSARSAQYVPLPSAPTSFSDGTRSGRFSVTGSKPCGALWPRRACQGLHALRSIRHHLPPGVIRRQCSVSIRWSSDSLPGPRAMMAIASAAHGRWKFAQPSGTTS